MILLVKKTFEKDQKGNLIKWEDSKDKNELINNMKKILVPPIFSGSIEKNNAARQENLRKKER